MADRVIMPTAFDANGDVVSGAVAYFYATGTLNAAIVYADTAGATELGVSVEANAAGVFPPIYTTQSLRLDIRDSEDVSLPGFPSDNWYTVNSQGLGANTITFEPVEGNPATTVSGAIRNLSALWANVSTLGRTLIGRSDPAFMRADLGLRNLATQDILDQDGLTTPSSVQPQSSRAVKLYVDTQVEQNNPVKAWVRFNGVGAVINNQRNVASVTRQDVGEYTINFATDISVNNYAITGTAGSHAPGDYGRVSIESLTASSAQIAVTDENGTKRDTPLISIIVVS